MVIKDVLKQKTKDRVVKMHAVGVMESVGSFLFTREYLKGMEVDAFKEIDRVGENVTLVRILNYLKKDYTVLSK